MTFKSFHVNFYFLVFWHWYNSYYYILSCSKLFISSDPESTVHLVTVVPLLPTVSEHLCSFTARAESVGAEKAESIASGICSYGGDVGQGCSMWRAGQQVLANHLSR